MQAGARVRRALGGAPPAGYSLVEGARGVLVVADEARADLEAAGFEPDGGEELAPSELSGRSSLSELRSGGRRLVVRHYRHGGLFRWLFPTRFADPTRPFDELALAVELEVAGIATPRVAAARAHRAPAFGWSLELVTHLVEGAREAAEILELARSGQLAPERRRALFAALGECCGRLHRAGFVHADLTPRNLLLGDGFLGGVPGRVWVIDLDRSRFVPRLADQDRRANLARLLRYVQRREERPGALLGRNDVARFLRAYRLALEPGPGAAGWRDDWRAVALHARRGALLHRLGWGLERLFGAGPAQRAGGAVARG